MSFHASFGFSMLTDLERRFTKNLFLKANGPAPSPKKVTPPETDWFPATGRQHHGDFYLGWMARG
jgi:hypothetical protein